MTRAINKLSDLQLRNSEWQGKSLSLSDGNGLFLEHRSTGKYWRFKYTYGKSRWLYLGVYPEVTLKNARDARDEARALVRKGIDPGEARKEAKAKQKQAVETEFQKVAEEWFEVAMFERSDSHRSRTRGYLLHQLSPLNGRTLAQITPTDLKAVLAPIRKRGTFDTARRVLKVADQVFEFGYVNEYFSGSSGLARR